MKIILPNTQELSFDWTIARDQVRKDLEGIASGVHAGWGRQHKTDGSHSAITADSLTLQGATAGAVTGLAYDAARFSTYTGGTWTVASTSFEYLRFSRFGQLVFVQFSIGPTTIAVDTPDYLVINMPELHALPGQPKGAGLGTPQYGGTLHWTDLNASNGGAGENGIGAISAQASEMDQTAPSTGLWLERVVDPGTVTSYALKQWPLSTTLYLEGSIWFTCEPNNEARPFYGA